MERQLFRLGDGFLGRSILRPGLIVTQKDATVDTVCIWIGAVLTGRPTTGVRATIEADRDGSRAWSAVDEVDLQWYSVGGREARIAGWDRETRFYHSHALITGLPPDSWTAVRVHLQDLPHSGGPVAALAKVRTLPTRLPADTPLRVFVGSCYDVETDTGDAMDAAYRAAFPGKNGADLTWLVGDQVYADAPAVFHATMARHTPRVYGLLKYWKTWGMQDGRGLRSILAAGPTWFLPDDHEFWNNWPHSTVTERHSWSNQGKALRGALDRQRHLRLPERANVPIPRDPGRVPRSAQQKAYLPVHPDEWDNWIRSSFELFGSFQTPSVADRAALAEQAAAARPPGRRGRITRGWADVGQPDRPPRGGPAHVIHQPLNQVLQRIDLDPVRVVLLDTRTRRVRRFRHPWYSNFVDQAILDEALEVAAEAPVLLLVTPSPLLVMPAWRTNRFTPERVPSLFDDRGIHDYWYQYQRMWIGLLAARAGRPTITIGGDIHRSYVAHAPELSLVEIVSSPMSLVSGLGLWEKAKTLIRSSELDDKFEPGKVITQVEDLLTGPRGGPNELLSMTPTPMTTWPEPGNWGAAHSLATLPAENPDGFATIDLRRIGDSVRVTVRLRSRKQNAADPEPVEILAHPDRRGPLSLEVE